jgi:HK97 family phage prohead protease
MSKILHPKILEYKKRSAPIRFSNLAVGIGGEIADDSASSDFDNRVVAGYGVNWLVENDYKERFHKGSATKSIRERGPQANAKMPIKMLNFHNQREPLALFETIEEDEQGLRFRSKPFDEVDYADRMLIHLRNKTVDNFSIGWNPVWDKMDYNDDLETIEILEMELYEISPVSLASDSTTYAIRNKGDKDNELIDLNDDINYFIKHLPRDVQLEARNLFARHKTLLEIEPPEEIAKALMKRKPNKTAVDYNYLLQNFKR